MKIGMYTASWNFNEYTAEQIAATFDMSQSAMAPNWRPEWDYSTKMNQVHTLNPNYKCLVYRSTINIIFNDPAFADELNYAISQNWVLKNDTGAYCIDNFGHYLADIANPAYQVWVANIIKSWIETPVNSQAPFFDGVMCDNALKVDQYGFGSTNGDPINPRTGLPFTTAEIVSGQAGVLNAVIDAVGLSKVVLPNGIWNGEAFYYNSAYRDTLNLVPRLNAVGSEGIFYQSYSGWYYTEENWKKSLDMLVWAQEYLLKGHPDRFFIGDVPIEGRPTDQAYYSDEQHMYFGFCSMMLGVEYSGQNLIGLAWNWNTGLSAEIMAILQRLRVIDMGEPLGSYFVENGVYKRNFTGGQVEVNPTTHIGKITPAVNLPFTDGFADLEKWTQTNGTWSVL